MEGRHALAQEIADYFDRLWPLHRSLTGEGVRSTQRILSELVPLSIIDIPCGTKVFDWTVPKEWVVREAYVIDPNGNRILDIKENNLHLVNYSIPFKGTVTKQELDDHLFSLPDRPTAIPYIISYYKARWGFCIAHEQREKLPEGNYQVVIDTDHIDGNLTIAEVVLPGETDEEVLFSTYTCHPSMGNNELSGPLVTAFLARKLAALPKRRYTYRFAFLVETIGCIAYLERYGFHFKDKLKAGFVVTCTGTAEPFTFKHSKRKATLADRAALYTLRQYSGEALRVRSYDPADSSDDRHYCSPGFNLPVATLMRTMYGTYPEYHTSLDNRDFVSFEGMAEAVNAYYDICLNIEQNKRYENLIKYGDPQLGPRGLYPSIGGAPVMEQQVAALLWFLNYADGEHDLLDIAELSGIPLHILSEAAEKCVTAGIAAELSDSNTSS